MIEGAAAFLAWAGAALIVLADGRRGLAAGLGVLTVGVALLEVALGNGWAAAALGVGGSLATFLRWTRGPEGWGIMPPGSTPRLILCVAFGLLAFWLAASVTTGPDAPLRFAVFAAVGLTGARALMARDSSVAVTAVAGLALVVTTAAGLADTPPGLLPYEAGAAFAAGFLFIDFMSRQEPNGS